MKNLCISLVIAYASFGCDSGSSEPAPGDAARQNPQSDAGTVSDLGTPPITDAMIPNEDASVPQDGGLGPAVDAGMAGNRDDCTGLCEYLEMCGSCFYDPQGECLDVNGCTDVCLRETSPTVAACAAQLPACDESAFQGCYDANIGDDDCAQTCRFLEECDECFVDKDGECLTLAGCAAICRDSTPPAAAACIANLSDCAGITDCY